MRLRGWLAGLVSLAAGACMPLPPAETDGRTDEGSGTTGPGTTGPGTTGPGTPDPGTTGPGTTTMDGSSSSASTITVGGSEGTSGSSSGDGGSTQTTGTTGAETDGDTDTTTGAGLPSAPELTLTFSPIRQFDFTWASVAGADHYELEESAAPGEPFLPLGGDVMAEAVSHERPLHLRREASYRLRACNVAGCTDSAVVDVASSLAEAVGYFKASSTAVADQFGARVALSADGSTLAVGAFTHDGGASDAGAVYVFVRDGAGAWSQQAYVQASNLEADDAFGSSVSLSADGSTLAVGAPGEDGAATGIDGDQASNAAASSGAVYVLVRDGAGAWSQQAYVKASNTGMGDGFGGSVSLSGDGDTLAVGADLEDGGATGIGGDPASNAASNAGAVYVLVRDGAGAWSQQAYVKASNTDAGDRFGQSLALSGDGDTLVVGAYLEDGSGVGLGGNPASDGAMDAGAAYVLVRDATGAWSQQAYVKPSNTDVGDWFGIRVAISGDGDTVAVGAFQEDGSATGIDGDDTDDGTSAAGAVYVLERDGAGVWSQAAYVKATNTDAFDAFGYAVALSGDGGVLAVGAIFEDGSTTGVGGDEADDGSPSAGAAYTFVRDGMGAWSPWSYVKAPNTDPGDLFGASLALGADGHVLAVGAYGESSGATGIGGDATDDTVETAGAVYLY